MHDITSAENATSTQPGEGNQFLTFALGNEEYGIEILKVQEIKGYSGFTPIPNSPPFVKGVMNLRGTVVPIFDLRARFAMNEAEYSKFTVVIVVNVGKKVIGLIVDAVSDVMSIASDQIDPSPDLGGGFDNSLLRGIAKSNERLVALLDIEKICLFDHANSDVANSGAA